MLFISADDCICLGSHGTFENHFVEWVAGGTCRPFRGKHQSGTRSQQSHPVDVRAISIIHQKLLKSFLVFGQKRNADIGRKTPVPIL